MAMQSEVAAIRNPIVDKDGVWFLRDHRQFPYNEGNRAELYVLDVIRRATDISSESRELETHIRDWSSLYHLSRERSLAYRSLNIRSSTRILEVGCGCGSVTRLLGERSSHVLALEGSPRRAEITRERTRDLQSVQVVCGSYEDIQFASQFDLVICNGVFEYASVFVKHDDPHRHMLKLLSALVAPGGSLVIAIENKVGLRYFSSGKEEHTNVMYDGLEGYPRRPNGARTFGATELQRMLSEVFPSVEVLIPLPDYKLPTALVRAELLQRVNCAELFANTARHDYGSRVVPQLHERLVWHELQKSGLLREFANSLFVVSGDKATSLLSSEWLGDIYSIHRKSQAAMRTSIVTTPDGGAATRKAHLEPPGNRAELGPVAQSGGTSRWSSGESIHTLVSRALMRDDGSALQERLRAPVLHWWKAIGGRVAESGRVPGSALDLNWQNVLVESGETVTIDQEWTWQEEIDAAWLVVRAVSKFVSEETPYFARWNRKLAWATPYKVMHEVATIAGVRFNTRLLAAAARSEVEFQRHVTNRQLNSSKVYWQCFEPFQLRAYRKAVGAIVTRIRAKMASLLG